MSVAATHEAARSAAEAREAASSAYYSKWGMREASMSSMGLEEGRDLTEWTVVGTPATSNEPSARTNALGKREGMGVRRIDAKLELKTVPCRPSSPARA